MPTASRSAARGFPSLRAGDLVHIVSPASRPTPAAVEATQATLEAWGLRVECGRHVLDRHAYRAGTDGQRLADLNRAIRDPEVRAIVASRGGAGAYRIADRLDLDALRRDPKPLVGFSDISFLHLAAWNGAGVGGIHGSLASAAGRASVHSLLMGGPLPSVRRRADAVSAAASVPGRASGRLVGGNLTAVATSIGTPRMPNLDGALLLVEDLPHKTLGFPDRLLTALRTSGAIDGVAGVVLGSFEGFRDIEVDGWTVVDLLRDHLEPLGVPVLGGIDAGHDLADQVALPLGAVVSIDADAGTLAADLGDWRR